MGQIADAYEFSFCSVLTASSNEHHQLLLFFVSRINIGPSWEHVRVLGQSWILEKTSISVLETQYDSLTIKFIV